MTMTPDKAAQLQHHLEAIAQLLYEESEPTTLETLEDIELTVREQVQTHVTPELGRFLSARSAARVQDGSAP